MNLPQFHLGADVHVCLTGRYYIFLDLRRNLYRSVSATRAASLARRVVGWGASEELEPGSPTMSSHDDQILAEDLLSCRLLDLMPPGGPLPRTHATDRHPRQVPYDFWSRPGLGRRRALPHRLAVALIRAHTQLSFDSLYRIVAGVRRRKAARTGQGPTPDCSAHAVHLTEVFSRYRPYFPRNYLCLYDSLALVHYLAANELFPTWVFGVREEPFYAHCWVQADNLVLNDHPDRVAIFTPIMRV